ncbi:MAG: 16S rRNA (cytosine(1402)-N(4))-methyltransferase RsmH [Pseudomonadota bacterium]
MSAHTSVLLAESVDALVSKVDGFYVDGTFGRGGHARALLQRLSPEGRLLGCDKDAAAQESARALEAEDKRFTFRRGSFADLHIWIGEGGAAADGVLLDLGVSSPQLDDGERGFSFQCDGPLDMRMDQRAGVSAADWLAGASQAEVEQVLRDYGEERYARRIATAIVEARTSQPLLRTRQLAEIVKAAHPRWEPGRHPATRAFQAIRIHVNRELDDLNDFLGIALSVLAVGGRLVVISFHSLEDRLVKRQLRSWASGPRLPRHIPVRSGDYQPRVRILGKAIRPSAQEVDANPRARSAIMRCAQRLH